MVLALSFVAESVSLFLVFGVPATPLRGVAYLACVRSSLQPPVLSPPFGSVVLVPGFVAGFVPLFLFVGVPATPLRGAAYLVRSPSSLLPQVVSLSGRRSLLGRCHGVVLARCWSGLCCWLLVLVLFLGRYLFLY